MMPAAGRIKLKTLIGNYPSTAPLKDELNQLERKSSDYRRFTMQGRSYG